MVLDMTLGFIGVIGGTEGVTGVLMRPNLESPA
jgi:hypothetical protein